MDAALQSWQRRNRITLVLLLLLIAVAWRAAETGSASGVATPIVAGAMALKFLGVFLVFMEMSAAHLLWRALAVAYVAATGLALLLVA